MGSPLIVEFFGPEGSGKSTAVRKLAYTHPTARIRKANGKHRLDFGDRLTGTQLQRQRLLAPLALPSFAWACMRHMTERRAIRRIADLCHRESFSRRAARLPGLNLLDEGPLHRLLVYSSRGYVRDPEALWRHLSPPDLAVFVFADAELAVRRLTERAERLGGPVRERWHPTQDRYRDLAHSLIEAAPYPVLPIDTSQGGDVSVAVSRWIEKQLTDRRNLRAWADLPPEDPQGGGATLHEGA